MSHYTTQLIEVIKSFTFDERFKPFPERIEEARTKIFDFDYPIWNEEHKKQLETKILFHYLNYEIGLETYPLWKLYLQNKMNEIMPYYVDKYNAIYPFADKLYVNRDIHESHNETGTSDTADSFTAKMNRTEDTDYTRKNTENANGTGKTTNNLQEDTQQDNSTSDNQNKTVQKDSTNTRTDDLTQNEKGTLNKDTTVNSTSNSSNLHIESDLPQTNLNGLDYATRSVEDSGQTTVKSTETVDQDDTRNTTNTGTQKNVGTENETDTTTIEHTGNNHTLKKDTGTVDTEYNDDKTQDITDKTGFTADQTDNTSRTIDNDTTRKYDNYRYGNDGLTYSQLIAQYLPEIQNLDMQIIKDLKPLFMLIF